jgi:hypothetical protein
MSRTLLITPGGLSVAIFRARELYTMAAYANRYTKSRIHFAAGLAVLIRVLEDRYKDLAGGLLEGVARLFTHNVRLVVYPMAARRSANTGKSIGTDGLDMQRDRWYGQC